MSERSVPEGPPVEEVPDGLQDGVAVATREFCEAVAHDLGIKPATARSAFLGEPTQQVLGVMSWALDRAEDPKERSRMVIGWAKKRGAGAFRPQPDEFISLAGNVVNMTKGTYRENEALARMLVRYWNENPKRLARVLDELEIWLNVFPEKAERNPNGNGRR